MVCDTTENTVLQGLCGGRLAIGGGVILVGSLRRPRGPNDQKKKFLIEIFNLDR